MNGESKSFPLLMDIARTAEELSITGRQVYRLIEDGSLLGVKQGRRRMVTTESVLDYVAALIAQSKAAA